MLYDTFPYSGFRKRKIRGRWRCLLPVLLAFLLIFLPLHNWINHKTQPKVVREEYQTASEFQLALRENKNAIMINVTSKGPRFKYDGLFINHSRETESLCLVLAGYKPFLNNVVLGRLVKYLDADIDCCIVTSGLISQELIDICERNKWSYLSLTKNDICLSENAALDLHPLAKYIFKIDEDIFITKGYFRKMKEAYKHAQGGLWNPGVIAPLINVNLYSSTRILDLFNATTAYEQLFGKAKYPLPHIWSDAEAAQFFWGKGQNLPSIDEMNILCESLPQVEVPCPIRFSIGAILFERSVWESMGYFSVTDDSYNLGRDEVELGTFCLLQSRPIMVSENVVVGHFGYYPQREGMIKFFSEHPDSFQLPNVNSDS